MTTANWSSIPGGPYNAVWVNGDVAVFEGTGGTVNVAAGVTANSITITANSYVFSGGIITLGSATTPITVNAGLTATIDSQLTGTGKGFSKLSTGTLQLGGANTFNGGVFVNAGIVRLTSSGALGSTSGVTLINSSVPGGSGTALELQNDITIPAPIALNSNATGNYRTSIRSTSGNNALTGTLTLNGSHIEQLYADSGSLAVGNIVAGAGGFTGELTLRGGAGIGTLTGTINLPAATLVKTESSTWFISSAGNTWLGTRVGEGMLKTGIDGALPAATTLNMGQGDNLNATFDLNGFNQTISGLVLSAAGGLKVITSSAPAKLAINSASNITYNGTVSGILSLEKSGVGTLVLSGFSTYSGATSVKGGVLQFDGPFGSTDAITIASGAVLIPNQATTSCSSFDVADNGVVSIRIFDATGAPQIVTSGEVTLAPNSILRLDLQSYPSGTSADLLLFESSAVPDHFGSVEVVDTNGPAEQVQVVYASGGVGSQIRIVINGGSPTTTTASDALAPYSDLDQLVPLTATVTSPDGPVTAGYVVFQVRKGNVDIGSAVSSPGLTDGVAQVDYLLPALTAIDQYTILASFIGTADFPSSLDSSHTLSVELPHTTLNVANAAVPASATDQTANFSATVVSTLGIVNDGNVTFQVKDGDSDIGSAVSAPVTNGSASAAYIVPGGTPIGTYTINAIFASPTLTGSSDNTHTLKVLPLNGVFAENAAATYRIGAQSVTLNAAVSGDLGIVNDGTFTFQVKDGANNVGNPVISAPVANGAASAAYTLPAGTPVKQYAINVSYSGGANAPPGSDNSKVLTIGVASASLAAASLSLPFNPAAQVAVLSAQVTSPAGLVDVGTVTFQLKSGNNDLGAPVTSGTVNAGSASVTYTIPAATPPGTYAIQAAYSGSANLDLSSDNSKALTIEKGVPVITWATPGGITYGATLGASQLNASVAGLPGSFSYTPPAGTKLDAGNGQQLSVTFTPDDAVNYAVVSKTVFINVSKLILTVTAEDQARLVNTPNPEFTAAYSGFAAGETAAVLGGSPQLATTAIQSSPPGTYPIVASQGTLNSVNYTFVFVNGVLSVTEGAAFSDLSAPTVPYGTPQTTLSGKITFGTTGIVNITFNGVTKSATIDGTGAFSADFDTSALNLGSYPIAYHFPGGAGLDPVTASRVLTVIKGNPVITWSDPADIEYGTALSATQLNAVSALPGTFDYTPASGTQLEIGSHQLSVKFFPTDAAHYVTGSATVNLDVVKAIPLIDWPAPADIVYGTALSGAQLNASCPLPGVFTYDPAAGTVLNAGAAQTLSVNFVPTDTTHYVSATASVSINVAKADQTITFDPIADQQLGSAPFTVSASASSGLPVDFSIVSGPAEVNVNVITLLGAGSVVVQARQAGDTNFNPATQTRTFSVIGNSPQLTNALSASGTQNQAFSFTLTSSGAAPITFESTALPAGLTLAADTGVISGTPTVRGAFQIQITARNSAGSDTETLTITLAGSSGQNHAPKFVSGAVATPNPAVVSQEIAFTVTGSDEDGDSIAIAWDFGDGAQGLGATAAHSYAAAGVFTVKVTISDGALTADLTLTIVVNTAVIPPDQYRQYTVSKLGLKFNFAKPNVDSLSISGTIPIPQAFSPLGKLVIFESAELHREWTLDKKATSPDKAFKLTGKLAKDGTFTVSPAKFAMNLKNQSLFAALESLGFINDNTPKGMIVPMPVAFVIEGAGYIAIVDVKYAAKKGKSGSGKK